MHKEKVELCIGVLDIYGFEIFEVSVCDSKVFETLLGSY